MAKCKEMHLGNRNRQQANQLVATTEERDPGVVTTNKLKPSAQCVKAARTANTVLGQINRAFHFREKNVMVNLYKQYVRLHLEFVVQAWAPWTSADKDLLNDVQKRAVRAISGLQADSYTGKLEELGLTTLEERRHRADMALVHSTFIDGTDIEGEEWFEPASEGTRSTRDPLNVKRGHGRLEIRKNFLTVGATEPWNKSEGM